MTTSRQAVRSYGTATFLMFSMGRIVEFINTVSAAMETSNLQQVALVFEVNSQAMRCCAICARFVVDLRETASDTTTAAVDRDHQQARLERLFEALTAALAAFPEAQPSGDLGGALAELQRALENMREALAYLQGGEEANDA